MAVFLKFTLHMFFFKKKHMLHICSEKKFIKSQPSGMPIWWGWAPQQMKDLGWQFTTWIHTLDDPACQWHSESLGSPLPGSLDSLSSTASDSEVRSRTYVPRSPEPKWMIKGDLGSVLYSFSSCAATDLRCKNTVLAKFFDVIWVQSSWFDVEISL